MRYGAPSLTDSRCWLLVLLAAAPAARAVQTPLTSWDGQSPEVAFGSTIANAGDVNGDGVPDAVVGAPNTLGLRGAARVLSGADGSTLFTFSNPGPGGKPLDELGSSAASCGDLDGDGRSEFAIGQPNIAALSLGGRVRIYRGSDGTVLHEFTATAADQDLGRALADVGDLDGDGLDELAVGAAHSDAVSADAGAVFILSGATGAVIRTFGLAEFVDPPQFGWAVSSAGDNDLDGVPDVAVGAPNFSPQAPMPMPGAVFVFSGAAGSSLFSLVGNSNDRFGTSVAGGFDEDVFGVPDLLVGAPQFFVVSATGNGYAALVLGNSHTIAHTFHGERLGDATGTSVALADLDLDGYAELIVGEPQWDSPTHFSAGRVRVFAGLSFEQVGEVQGQGDNEQLGREVAALGDLGDDLAPEWAAGVPNSVATTMGQVQVFASHSAWTDLGQGLAGAAGVPQASGTGSLEPGSKLTLSLQGAKPTGTTTLILGSSAANAPFKGGVLVPSPELLLTGLPLSGGALSLQGLWPVGIPSGFTLWLQFWTADGGAPKGFSASHALSATAP
jgi:hypothetical protein